MKLTRNEILILTNHYDGLMHDLDARMVKFDNTYNGIVDYDLYQTQMDRFRDKLKSYESRINELETELDKL